MLIHLLKAAFQRRKKRMAVAILAVIIGASLLSALLSVSLQITEKVGRELRRYGANILVLPRTDRLPIQIAGIDYGLIEEQSYLDEKDLPKIKTIFWRHNILGFTPYLDALVAVEGRAKRVALTGAWFEKSLVLDGGKVFKTGVRRLSPWWAVKGRWPGESNSQGALLGANLAQELAMKPGDTFTVSYQEKKETLKVSEIVTTGGFEDNQIFVNLKLAQSLLGVPQKVGRVLVSALVIPEKKGKRPEEMTPQEYERWYCTPYISSIARQIEEVIAGSKATPIRQIAETEGRFLSKVQLLLWLVAIVALTASALGVATTMTSTVLERRGEIGLMKAIGAENSQIAFQFLIEAGLIGLLGGVLGYLLGIGLAWFIGRQVFNVAVSVHFLVLPLSLAVSIGVALLGSIFH